REPVRVDCYIAVVVFVQKPYQQSQRDDLARQIAALHNGASFSRTGRSCSNTQAKWICCWPRILLSEDKVSWSLPCLRPSSLLSDKAPSLLRFYCSKLEIMDRPNRLWP